MRPINLAGYPLRLSANSAFLALAIIVGGAAQAAPATPDDAAKRTYAEQYLTATHSDQKLQEGIDQFIPGLVESMKRTHPTATPAQLEKFRQSLKARLSANKAAVRAMQVDVLTRTFSLKELKEAAAYQSSPTGQHFQSATFQVMSQIAAQRQQLFTEAYQAAMKDAAAPANASSESAKPVIPR